MLERNSTQARPRRLATIGTSRPPEIGGTMEGPATYAIPTKSRQEPRRAEESIIAVLITEYREVKKQADALSSTMAELREKIQLQVEVQPYEDEVGHAKMRVRAASVSYPAAEVERVTDVWLNSEVPEIRTCGEMLRSLGKARPETTYLEIR